MGLFPEADCYLVGPKNISLLYEYWCYLTGVRLVVEESHGEFKVSPVASPNPLDILLSSGQNHAAEVKLPNGQTIQVLYERQFPSLSTVTQKPDHVVQLKAMDALVVFDAKYRFELDDRTLEYYGNGSPSPSVSTINGMHQYHDAIVMRHAPHQRLVVRAIVLLPLPNAYVGAWDQIVSLRVWRRSGWEYCLSYQVERIFFYATKSSAMYRVGTRFLCQELNYTNESDP